MGASRLFLDASCSLLHTCCLLIPGCLLFHPFCPGFVQNLYGMCAWCMYSPKSKRAAVVLRLEWCMNWDILGCRAPAVHPPPPPPGCQTGQADELHDLCACDVVTPLAAAEGEGLPIVK